MTFRTGDKYRVKKEVNIEQPQLTIKLVEGPYVFVKWDDGEECSYLKDDIVAWEKVNEYTIRRKFYDKS